MKDHVEASAYADSKGLRDHLLTRPISATIKTVWSASMLSNLVNGKEAVVGELRAFRSVFGHIELPPDYNWLARTVGNLCKLFEFVEAGESENNLDSILHGAN